MEINSRVNRIIGQLKGVQKMITEKRECNDILQQITALKKAIDGLSKELVVSDICRYTPKSKSKKIEKMVGQVIDL